MQQGGTLSGQPASENPLSAAVSQVFFLAEVQGLFKDL